MSEKQQPPDPRELKEAASQEMLRGLQHLRDSMGILLNAVKLSIACMQAYENEAQQREAQLKSAGKAYDIMVEEVKAAKKNSEIEDLS